MKSLTLKFPIFFLTMLSAKASYTWTVNGTADDTSVVSAPGSFVDGLSAEYFRYSGSDLGNQILSGTFTELGVSVDFAVTLTEYNNDHVVAGTTPSANDESFALYDDGQLDLFTFLSREPTNGDPSNLTRAFRFDFYDSGTLGNTNTQGTVGTFSMGSPLDSNAILKLAMREHYEMTWNSGGSGYAYDLDGQINESVGIGFSIFNADPDIDNVLDSNYGVFSAPTLTSFELRRQDSLNAQGRTGVRSGITLGGKDLVLPGGGSIPEPNSVMMLFVSSLLVFNRRRLK